ncbi:hypothetical protein [Nocardia arizonensis]|uniref:hypothetical protein n=1 Tax=Nocardia arizonensis TaxID=1141647 RepID=UPI0012E150D3|nr:hypothetical protein [Nocardia arizonensis]
MPQCAGEMVDIHSHGDVIGSVTRFNDELERVVGTQSRATLLDITRAAGFSDEWDRMVDVYPGIDPVDLNRAAAVDLAAQCWRGLPGKWSYDDNAGIPRGDYVFFRAGRPVQAVFWSADRKLIDIDAGVGLTPESLLVTDPRKRVLRPAP